MLNRARANKQAGRVGAAIDDYRQLLRISQHPAPDYYFEMARVEAEIQPDGRDGRRIAIKFIRQIEDKALRKEIPLGKRPRAILRVSRERESLDQVVQQFHILIIGISVVVLVAVTLSVTRASDCRWSGFTPI